MVHVLDLLGCIAQGATTDEALQATPKAIRDYLSFLSRHGEVIDPLAEFSVKVAEHVTQGAWLGNGDPTPGFQPDFQLVSSADLKIYVRRLEWTHAALAAAIADLSIESLVAQPEGNGRTFYGILAHAAESECTYLRMGVGKVIGMSEALKPVQAGPQDLATHLNAVWKLVCDRFAGMNETELTQQVHHGQVTWTAFRGLRRALEHNWEHLVEISTRLGEDVSQY